MKTELKAICILFFSVILSACSVDVKQVVKDTSATMSDSTMQVSNITLSEEEKEKHAHPQILEFVNFFNEEIYNESWSLKAYELPDAESKEVFSFYFGDSIPVIQYEGDWLRVLYVPWNRMSVIPTDFSDVKRGYIRKSWLGDIEDLRVLESDLQKSEGMSELGMSDLRNDDKLTVVEIDKDIFEKAKNAVVVKLDRDSTNVSKKNGLLTLKCGAKTIKLQDVDPAESFEGMKEYTYKGIWPELNMYVVCLSGLEHLISYVYDANTGDVIYEGTAIPIVSPDGRFIADIWGNPYESITEFMLKEKQANGKYEEKLARTYIHWMPALCNMVCDDDYFYGVDGDVYVRVVKPSIVGTGANENVNTWQYIRIIINI